MEYGQIFIYHLARKGFIFITVGQWPAVYNLTTQLPV